MSTFGMSEEARVSLDDLQDLLDGYKPLRQKLWELTNKYQDGFISTPGTKPLMCVSVFSLLAGVGSVAAAATTGAAVAPLAIPLFAIAGAAQCATGLNYITGRIIHPIAKMLARGGFDATREADRLKDLIEGVIERNPHIPRNEKDYAIQQVVESVSATTKALFTDSHKYGELIAAKYEEPIAAHQQELDKISRQSKEALRQAQKDFFDDFEPPVPPPASGPKIR